MRKAGHNLHIFLYTTFNSIKTGEKSKDSDSSFGEVNNSEIQKECAQSAYSKFNFTVPAIEKFQNYQRSRNTEVECNSLHSNLPTSELEIEDK